jgi:hypothetical protein
VDLPLIIKELIHTGGSVVVPGLGKFYTIRRPARIDPSKNLLIPPGHTLHFDPKTSSDDGNLSSYICRKQAVDAVGAMKAISEYVASVKNELSENGHALIPDVGNLEAGEDGISFNPLKEEPLTGLLPSLEIPAGKSGETVLPQKDRPGTHSGVEQKREVPQPAERKQEMPSKSTPRPVQAAARRRSERNSIVWLPVTLLILIVGLAATLYFTGTFQSIRSELGLSQAGDTAGTENGNRMVFGRPPAGLDSGQEALSRQLDDMTAKENALAYREPGPDTQTGRSMNAANPESENVMVASMNGTETGTGSTAGDGITTERPISGTYHIIAGSFRIQDNAEKQKEQLNQQGLNPSIIRPEDPYYMVSLASFATPTEATAALDRFRRQLDISLWVKKVE